MATAIELSPIEIEKLCQRYLRDGKSHDDNNNNNFEVLNYKLKPTSDAPAGFLGRHLYLNVELLFKSESDAAVNQVKVLRFFAKSAPSDISSRMEYVLEFGVFKKEILVYRHILPELQAIYADVAPKCYYADNNLLVFENLAEQGYRMGAGRDGLLNYEHLSCLLKTLAALHAGSIACEVKMSKKCTDIYPNAVIENAYPSNVPLENMRLQNFNNANEVLKEIIKTLPKYTSVLDYVLQNFNKRMQAIFQLVQVSSKYQNVFSHGDLWANNIMFQYGKYGEMPIQCRFVDFQLARYAPPMLDVITVLTIPTSRAFRAKYLTELLEEYYNFMSEFLKREGLSIEQYIPRKQYLECFEEYRIAGLIESCLFSHLTILPPESTQQLTTSTDGFSDFFDRKRVEICMDAFRNDTIYRERLSDMIEDFVDNFVLK